MSLQTTESIAVSTANESRTLLASLMTIATAAKYVFSSSSPLVSAPRPRRELVRTMGHPPEKKPKQLPWWTKLTAYAVVKFVIELLMG